jgi:hypothetical protein
VSLDVGKYGEPDRERATIDLAEAVLKTGRGATWSAASIGAGSVSGMCTMPSFPATAVEGAAFNEVAEAKAALRGHKVRSCLGDNPGAQGNDQSSRNGPPTIESQNNQGQNLCARSRPRAPLEGFGSIATIEIAEGPKLGNQIEADVSETYSGCQAVVIGGIKHFMLPATAARASRRATLIMLLSGHDGHWHKSGLAVVEKAFTENWYTCIMSIGSPA